MQFRVNKEVHLVPQYLTKVQFHCNAFENFDGKEGILLNDKLYKDVIIMDDCLIWFEANTCYVYVSNQTEKKIILRPREVFCEGIGLNHGTLTLTEKAFACLSFSGSIDKLESEISQTDFPQCKSQMVKLLTEYIYIVALTGDKLGKTNVIENQIVLKKDCKPFFVPKYKPFSLRVILVMGLSLINQTR